MVIVWDLENFQFSRFDMTYFRIAAREISPASVSSRGDNIGLLNLLLLDGEFITG